MRNGVLPAGRVQLGPSTKCQLKYELRAATSLFTARWESTNRGQSQALAQASAKSGYISLYPGWHNGLYTMHNGVPPTGRVPAGASHQLSARRALYRSCTSCSTLFMCTVCCILNKAIIIIIIIKCELRAATSQFNAYWESANQGQH